MKIINLINRILGVDSFALGKSLGRKEVLDDLQKFIKNQRGKK